MSDEKVVFPGDILKEEFMRGVRMTKEELATTTGIDIITLDNIFDGTQRIDDDLDAKLCAAFFLPRGYWTRVQENYDNA